MSSEQLARESAFYAGQLWALDKLIHMNDKYTKGG